MSLTEDDKTWIKDQLTGLEEKLSEQRVQLEHRIERVETNLLTEFYKWASPVEARQRSHAAALHALDLELDAHSERIKKLESR